MTKKTWSVVLILGLGTALFFWLMSSMFMGGVKKYKNVSSGYGKGGMEVQDIGIAIPGEPAVMLEEYESTFIEPDYLPPRLPGGDALEEIDRDYEYYSNYQVVTDNVSDYMSNLKAYVISIEGRVLSSSMSSSKKYASGSLTMKVSVASFEATNAKVTSEVDEVVSESVQSADVTGTTVFLSERKLSLEDELLDLQEKLDESKTDAEKRRLELQIDRVESQLKNLEKQIQGQEERVSYATVTVSVASDRDYYGGYSSKGETDLQEQLELAWQTLWFVLQKMIVFAIWVGVFAVLWLPAVLLVVWLKKKQNMPVQDQE